MILLLMNKIIDYDNSEILYNEPESAAGFQSHWEVKSAKWRYNEGWFEGINQKNSPGMIVSRADYFGNIIVRFTAKTMLPSNHDIDVMWNGSWDDKKNERALAYVAGIQGWWEGKVGIEKSPDCLLNAMTPLFDFIPGKEYDIIAGSVDGHIFIFIDGKLILEVTDPDPIDTAKHGKVGFEAYCSHIMIKNIEIRRAAYTSRNLEYPE